MRSGFGLCAAALSLFVATLSPAAEKKVQSRVDIGRSSVAIPPNYQSPTPHEIAVFEPVKAEAFDVYEKAKLAKIPLRHIRECEKGVEETTSTVQMNWIQELERAKASTDTSYLAYLEAEKRLDQALSTHFAGMTREQRIREPLVASIVRVIPYMYARENTYPTDSEPLDDYKNMYQKTRSQTPCAEGQFEGLQEGFDPDFAGLCALFDKSEKAKGYPTGYLHAIAWRESEGNVQQGAENADERGLFQIQTTDYQPEFGVPMPEPAALGWDRFDLLCKWIPFNLAVKEHCLDRLAAQARLYGFQGQDVYHLAYRFYNESSGYIVFSQERLKIYRELFGASPAELSDTDIPLLDRFIYFKKEELLLQYDWPYAGSMPAGEALWNAWQRHRMEITSDLLWLVLKRRLIESKQYFTLSETQDGRRWCEVDLTMQNAKRRGQPGIPGLMMAAIGICGARGNLPTAELFHNYFENAAAMAAAATPATP